MYCVNIIEKKVALVHYCAHKTKERLQALLNKFTQTYIKLNVWVILMENTNLKLNPHVCFQSSIKSCSIAYNPFQKDY